MAKLIARIILFASLAGLSSCSPSGSARSGRQETRGGHNVDQILSHIYGVEAEVTGIDIESGKLKSLTLKVIKPLDMAIGYTPYEGGELVIIDFDQRVSDFAKFRLRRGSVVAVYFGQIGESAWGSNAAWMGVKKNDVLYGADGRKAEAGDLFPH